MKIHHKPNLSKIKEIERHYSKEDNTPVRYLCTSATNDGTTSMDIFYRETPHPEFGNRYFGLFNSFLDGKLRINNADVIEELDFCMIEHNGELHYSRHRHDFVIKGGKFVDGGRAYFRTNDENAIVMKIKDGEFVQETSN